ncbi:MAG: hypothetical protein Q8R36_01250 [bacterium]|nr:hypothetical protein [bacterium]
MSLDPRLVPLKTFFERPWVAWAMPYIDSQTVRAYLTISVLSISLIFLSGFFLRPSQFSLFFTIVIMIEIHWGWVSRLSLLSRLVSYVNITVACALGVLFFSLLYIPTSILVVILITTTIWGVVNSYKSMLKLQMQYPQGLKTKLYECLDLS